MDVAEVAFDTRASTSVSNGAISDPIVLDADLFVVGTNRMSVEVHNRSPSSSDLVFGLELNAGVQVDDGVPPTPYSDNDEEWIELYNRGDAVVNLAGWELSDAVDFQFEAGQQIAPGEYLVIARDAGELRGKYPDRAAKIVGSYAGTLSNSNDRILLMDDQGNPADVVEYFQSGQWPSAADGAGSSLELRDPHADNSRGLAWAASDEAQKSEWQSYSYEGVARASSIGPDGRWDEFVAGMLDKGEVLLDDISIVLNPGGDEVELLQNGSFEADRVGEHPATWRLIGSHRHSEVVVDPNDPSNQVLRFVATKSTEHMHNHAETTLKQGDEIHRIRDGNSYRISYKAKWVTGSNQFHTRLYFNRLARATPVSRPTAHGTPGQPNSASIQNLGPTYDGFIHSPAVPQPDESVTVSVRASDAQGVQAMTLWHSIDSGAWQSDSMSFNDGVYQASIPPLAAKTIVQFYVEGEDGAGAKTTFPRDGRDSRALYKVDGGEAADTGLHNFRMILTPADADRLHDTIEVMSNDPLGATFVYNESEIFYNASIRLSGSQRARPFTPRLSFRVGFNADQLFRGVHSGITIDRSESTGFGQREHIYHQGMSHAGGGLPSEYNDLFNIITPLSQHTGGAEAQLARYSDLFLDEQYENGSAGQLYEYELTYFPTTTVDRDPEGRKLPSPDDVRGVAISDLGDSNEDYRWAFLNKNNRAEDDYGPMIDFAKIFSLRGDAFLDQIEEVVDVDQWLRGFAFSSITGHGDNYGADGSQHNFQIYFLPEDDRALFFPHDLDAFFNATRSLVGNGDLRKLMARPEWEHMFYGHVHDMIQTTFNETYMTHWTDLYQKLLPQQRFDRHLRDLVRRSEFLITQIERAENRVDFSASAETPNVDTTSATIQGNGWVNVREIRLQGSSVPLDVEWTDVTVWRAEVPVSLGLNQFEIEAIDFQGELIGTQTIEITSSVANPLQDAIRITELNYNPHAPTVTELAANGELNNDDFEFIELTNASAVPINLLAAHFSQGVEFVFPSVVLQPGQSTVVVQDEEAFRLRYGDSISVAGEFNDGQLSNRGERLTLVDATGAAIVDLNYGDSDPWPEAADGAGGTLSLIRPLETLAVESKRARFWHGNTQLGGTPGDALDFQSTIVINEVRPNTIAPELDAIELLNVSGESIDIGGWFLSDSGDRLMKFQIPENTTLSSGGYIVFNETNFNPTPLAQGPNDFALGGNGDSVFLTSTDNDGQAVAIIDSVSFLGVPSGRSLGREPNGSGRLVNTAELTLDAPNSAAAVGPIVISELSHAPQSPSEQALAFDPTVTSSDLEFIELHNTSSAPISLAGWRLRRAVDFDFTTEELPANATLLVVPFDPSNEGRLNAFRSHYQIAPDASLTVAGPYAGQLDNDWEQLHLRSLGTTADDAGIETVAEEVIYDTIGQWPTDTIESGKSLGRRQLGQASHRPTNWQAITPTPGTVSTFVAAADLNNDGESNIVDVELICGALHQGGAEFDLNQDGRFDFGDMRVMINNLFGTDFGDSNLDGIFNSLDLVSIFQVGRYEIGVPGSSVWSDGDWNCDGVFTSRDLVLAFQEDAYVAASLPSHLPASRPVVSAEQLAEQRSDSRNRQKSAEMDRSIFAKSIQT